MCVCVCVCVCVTSCAGNKWELSRSYKEVEQMCVSSNRGSSVSMPPPPPYLQQERIRPSPMPTSRGGMEGGVGPAVTLDTRGVRSQVRGVVQPSQGDAAPQLQGLKVALPPVTAPVERVIPIQMDGGRTVYQPQSTAQTAAMARVTLDDKVEYFIRTL